MNNDIFVFLDVDGVLNNQSTFNRSPYGFIGIDDENLRILGDLLDQIENVKIVLSSSWKICWRNHKKPNKDGKYLIKALNYIGYQISDFTQDIVGQPFYRCDNTRGDGIKRYLESHEHKNYLILDDESFDFVNCGLSRHFCHTNWSTGFFKEDIAKCLKIVNSNLADFESNIQLNLNNKQEIHKGREVE